MRTCRAASIGSWAAVALLLGMALIVLPPSAAVRAPGDAGPPGVTAPAAKSAPAAAIEPAAGKLRAVPTGPDPSVPDRKVDRSGPVPSASPLNDIWVLGPSVGLSPLNVSFQAGPTGGVPPYTLTWLFGDGSSFRTNNTTLAQHTYYAVGGYTVTLFTNDSANDSIWSSGRVGVEATLVTVGNVSVAPPVLDVGQAVVFTVAAAGGLGPLSYYWEGLPPGCLYQNRSSFYCVPSENGTFDVWVYVTDATQTGTSSNDSTVVVNPDPTVTSWVASPSSLAPGETTTLSVAVTGGLPPYNYTWSGLPAGCLSSNAATLTCRPSSYGVSNVTVDAVDRLGFHAITFPETLRVVPFGIGVPRASERPAEVGSRLLLSVNLSTGATPDLVEWIGQLPNCGSGYGTLLQCDPRTAGTFNLSVQLNDAEGRSAVSAPLALVVRPTLQLEVTEAPTPAIAGASWSLVATTSGGVGPLRFDYLGLPAGCVSNHTARLTCTPTAPSSTQVTVVVTDADGVIARQLLNVTVQVAPTSLLVQSGLLPLLGVGGAFAAVVAIGLTVILRRTRGDRLRADKP